MSTLGKGFVVQQIATDERGQQYRAETLYWESMDGMYTLKSAQRRFAHDFDQPSLTWVYVTQLPADREYIGTYPMPSGIR